MGRGGGKGRGERIGGPINSILQTFLYSSPLIIAYVC